MYQKADPASIKKNTAQMRHSCTLFHIYQKPTQEKQKNTAQMRHSCTLSFRWQTNQAIRASQKLLNPHTGIAIIVRAGAAEWGGGTLAVALPALSLSSPYQAIARSWHCQEHSAILLYTAESTCSFCLEHFPYYPGKRRRATNGVLVAKIFSGGGWSSRIGWRRILYTDASPTSQDKRRIAPARPT